MSRNAYYLHYSYLYTSLYVNDIKLNDNNLSHVYRSESIISCIIINLQHAWKLYL